jgi:tetratricopeptide (TPR) repeat protein
MVTRILGTERVPEDLETLILEKTEGVPFFVEEFLKSLKDLGIIESRDHTYLLTKDPKDLTIPSTIQDVIMARVDSLPEGAKEVLQTGSVIEREFPYELIQRVTRLPERELFSHLSVLKDAELLYERGVFPQSVYVFRHALTREVVYESILGRRRQILHGDIARGIEEIHSDNIVDYCEVLANHFIANDNYERGAYYSKMATKKAENIALFNDAITYSRSRIDCLERLHRTNEVKKEIIDSRVAVGLYQMQMGNFVQSKEPIVPVIDCAPRIADKKSLAQLYTIIAAHTLYAEENFQKAINAGEEAFDIATEINHLTSLFFSNFWLGIILLFNCDWEKSTNHIGNALDINKDANRIWGISTVTSWLSSIYYYKGDIDVSYKNSCEALRLADESGDAFSKALVYAKHGAACHSKMLLTEAEKYCLGAIDFATRINFLYWAAEAHSNLGEIYFYMDNYQESKKHYDSSSKILEGLGYCPSWINLNRMGSARAEVIIDDRCPDLRQLYEYESWNKVKLFQGQIRRYLGETLLNMDKLHVDEAENWTRKAIEADEANGMKWHLGQDYVLYSEAAKRRRDLSRAREYLLNAIGIFRECGADGWAKRTEEKLGHL